MRNHPFAVSLDVLVCCLFAGAIGVLAGCTSRLSDQVGFLPKAAASAASAAPSPTTTQPAEHLAHTLPEAGGSHPATPVSSPTPLPPTVAPTRAPVLKSPTPTAGFSAAIPTRLMIPAINLDALVLSVGWSIVEENGQPVSEWDVPGQRAVGWLNTSAPVAARGNTVLVGHQNVDGRVFENLEYMKPGDEIQVQTNAGVRAYIVAARMILLDKDQPLDVRRENARWIGPSNDERLTLVTCWPRNDNTHRLILVALPAP